jgi:hypothetical protein
MFFKAGLTMRYPQPLSIDALKIALRDRIEEIDSPQPTSKSIRISSAMASYSAAWGRAGFSMSARGDTAGPLSAMPSGANCDP